MAPRMRCGLPSRRDARRTRSDPLKDYGAALAATAKDPSGGISCGSYFTVKVPFMLPWKLQW